MSRSRLSRYGRFAPMLEGKTASLESCQIQRVLSSTRDLVSARRQLHARFWQHGAAEVELFNVCQSILRSPAPDLNTLLLVPRASSGECPRETLAASSFVLDFLYPNGAVTFLRKFVPSNLERYEWQAQRPYPGLSHSFFSSARRYDPLAMRRAPDLSKIEYDNPNANEIASGFTDISQQEGRIVTSDPEILRQALRVVEHAGTCDRIWHLYTHLDPEFQDDFRTEILVHMARSSRPVEAWRVCELFSLYDIANWTEELVDAGIGACLVLSDTSRALFIFRQALERHGMVQGLDALLAYGFRTSTWDLVIQAWEMFSNWQQKNLESAVPEPATEGSITREPNANAQPAGAPKSTETPESALPAFKEVSAIPDFSRKVSQLYTTLNKHFDADRAAYLRDNLDSLLRFLANKALALFKPKDAAFILERARDPLAYEEFMRLCMERDDKPLAVSMYRKYRLLPAVRIRIFVLRWMLSIFYANHDIRGMEQVREDWYGRYERLSRNAYQKYIAFYAGRGDVKSAAHMWQEYKKHFTAAPYPASDDPSPMVNLMHAHAVRGDVEGTRRIFDDFREQTGGQGTSMQWNILLNAHIKAADYDGAIDTFETLCRRGQADQYSFGTLMGMAGSRGDLQFTLDMYSTALDMGVQPDIAMADALLEGYCQNGRFTEAQRLCIRLTNQRKLEGNYATLWNTLLYHSGRRRDLPAVNRILEAMVAHKIPYDTETYNHLLNALVYCRQPHHALHLVSVAEREKVFQPTQRHYLLLMAAFIGSREPHMALRVNKMMNEARFPVSSERITSVIKALGRWQDLPSTEREGEGGHYYLAQALSIFRSSLDREEETASGDISSAAHQYSQIIFFLTQVRDFVTIREVMDLYAKQFPTWSSSHKMPMKLLTNLMLADFYEKKFDSVKQTWELILERTIRLGRPLGSHGNNNNLISPAYQFSLHDPLITMQRVCLAESDADGLVALVARVTAEGFQLDSKNWNYYVQALAQLKRWKEGFVVCEEKLMPQWGGWFRVRSRGNVKNKLPLQLRRLGSSPRYLRPISHTILILAREYLYLEQMAPWSTDAARILKFITGNCVRIVKAITTMIRSESELEKDIFVSATWGQSQLGEKDIGFREHGSEDPGFEIGVQMDEGFGMPNSAETVLATEATTSKCNAATSSPDRQHGGCVKNGSKFIDRQSCGWLSETGNSSAQGLLSNEDLFRHADQTRLDLAKELCRGKLRAS